MEPDKTKAIVAFYNIFAEELGIEDSATLHDLRQMIPIIVRFIKEGNLKFVDNADFRFASAVELLRSVNPDERLYTHLDAAAADRADDLEMAKILVALMYELRLVYPEEFTTYCDKLKPDENVQIANIIKYMDDRQSWVVALWPTILNSGSIFDETGNKENEAVVTPQNSKCGNFSFYTARTQLHQTTKQSSIYRSPARTSRAFGMDASQKPPTALSFNDSHSPVGGVVYSPRGEEVSRMRKLKRQNAELKEQRDRFGIERECIEERCTEQKKTIAGLMNNIKNLHDTVNGLRAETDKMAAMDSELIELRSIESALQTELHYEKNAHNEAIAARKHLALQRDAAEQRYGLKHAELEQVKADYDAAIRREQELAETLAKLHGELLDETRVHANNVAIYKQKLREMQEQLDHREKSWKYRLDEKDQELLNQVQLMNDVQMERGTLAQQIAAERDRDLQIARDTIEQLQKNLAEKELATQSHSAHDQQIIDALQETLRKKEEIITENTLVIASLRREKSGLELRIPELERRHKSLKIDFGTARDNWITTEETKNAQIGTLQREVETLRSHEERQTFELSEAKDKIATLTRELDRLTPMQEPTNSSSSSRKMQSISNFGKQDTKQLMSPSKLSRTQKSFRKLNTEKAMDEEARLKELRERNAKLPRVLQSHYLPETALMRGDLGMK